MYVNNYDIRQLSYMSRIILEFREKQFLKAEALQSV